MTRSVIIGVKQIGSGRYDTWCVTYDGIVLGDSRGYDRAGAIAQARITATKPDGEWQGSTWVPLLRTLDPSIC